MRNTQQQPFMSQTMTDSMNQSKMGDSVVNRTSVDEQWDLKFRFNNISRDYAEKLSTTI